MGNSKLDKIKAQTPVSILIHGGNRQGYLVTKTLIEQGCHVIIIDNYNSQTNKYISEFKGSSLVDFFEFKGLEGVFKNIKRYDYLFYFLNNALVAKEYDSKEFIREAGYLEESLKNSKKNNAKVALITSLGLNRELANRVNNLKLASPSPYSNIELQKYCETLSAEFRDKTNLNIRILRLGTTTGKGILKIDSDTIHNLVKDATQKPQITIKGEGLDIHNLIDEKDAVYGILKLTFSEKTKGEVITLANKNNYTTLSIAYKLLELNTEAQSIKFAESTDKDFVIQDLYVPAPHASKYGWTQQVSLEESLVDQLHTYYDDINKTWDYAEKPQPKIVDTVKTSKTKLGEFFDKILNPFNHSSSKKVSKKEKKEISWKQIIKTSIIAVCAILVTYFFIYPIIGTTIGLVIISSTAKDLKNSVFSMDSTTSEKKISQIKNNVERISTSLNNLQWTFKLLGKENLYANTSQLLLSTQYATDGANNMLDAISPLAQYVQEFEPSVDFQSSTPKTTREYTQYLNQITDNSYKVKEAAYKISLADGIMAQININEFPSFTRDSVSSIKDLIGQLSTGTNTFKDIVVFLPDLLGVTERQRYLVLLQNESELRSTGGWLTSYGIVGIEGGQIRELFVDDIYNADGTLKVQGKTFTSPKSMQQALGITNWPFSIINWYPDLTETKVSAQPYIEALGKGNDLDGVLTIDIAFIQKLLDKWGGIEVPGETEIVTSQNLYSKIFKMHEEFTPGSTQKTTFLADLANQIITKLLSMNIKDLIGLGDIFESSLSEKHLQATFKNTDAYNFFNDKSWAGSLDSRYNEAPITIDWNWGGNKANLYLNKNYNLAVNIQDADTLDFTYTITTENSSKTTTYPEGDYVNYQRVYIPSGATVLSVKGLKDNKFDSYKESGFKVVGGWFNIPINSTNTFEISYRISRASSSMNFPLEVNGKNIFFNLNLFKQAGETSHAYKLDITYPKDWNVESTANLNSISNQLSSRFELSKDQTYQIVWNTNN
jgi:nucleoside-diphosphate-sugar epimerase